MWSSTKSFPLKWNLFPFGSFYQKPFRAAFPYGRSLRRPSCTTARLLPPIQCMVSQYAWHPRLDRHCFLSSTALSTNTDVISLEEGNDVSEPKVLTTRRRRPLRISSVPSMNIAEQRLHHSRGSEYERKWKSFLTRFRAFVYRKLHTKKGQSLGLIKPTDYPKEVSLRNWLSRVRVEYKRKLRGQPSRLTEQRMAQLRKLGFNFIETTHRNTWDDLFQQLCTYLKKHDGRYPHEANISTLSKEDKKLYKWCNRQRVLFKLYMSRQFDKTYMTEHRIKTLNSINFVWSVLDSQWDERYEELKHYHKEHGTTLVPSRCVNNYTLSRWVETQRRQYSLRNKNKPSSLTDERIQLLNDLEFVWDPFDVRWMERYGELVEYQRVNGQYEMPTHASDPSLRRWVLNQRKQFIQWVNGEPSKMTAQRKELLDRLGMDWTPPPTKKSRGK